MEKSSVKLPSSPPKEEHFNKVQRELYFLKFEDSVNKLDKMEKAMRSFCPGSSHV